MNLDDVLKNKVIVKLTKQVTEMTIRLAETEAKAEMFKELLEVREQELAAFQKDDKKMEKKGSANVLK